MCKCTIKYTSKAKNTQKVKESEESAYEQTTLRHFPLSVVIYSFFIIINVV